MSAYLVMDDDKSYIVDRVGLFDEYIASQDELIERQMREAAERA